MFCNKCGAEIDDDSIFCTSCGAKIDEPDTIISTPSEPGFLKNDSEPTVLLTEDELQDAFVKEYGTESPEIGHPTDNSRDFFYNPDMAENTDDLMPFNEYESGEAVNTAHDIPKSFNDNSDTISFDAVEDDDYPPIPEPVYPQPEPEYSAPMYQEPYADVPPSPVQEQRRPQPAKIGAARLFGAFLIAVAAFLFLLVFSVTLSIKLGLNGHIVRNNISRVNEQTLIASEYEGRELSSALYGSLGFKNATGGMATESSFRNFLLRTDLVNYIGRTADSYLSYIIDGKGSDPSITSDDLVYDFIKGNNRASIEEWGNSMTDTEYQAMVSNLENNGFSRSMSIAEWGTELGFSLRNLKFLFSIITIAVFLIITALLFIWTALAVSGRGKYVTSYFGGIFRASGSIMILIGGISVLGSALAYVFTHQAVFYLLSYGLLTFALISVCTGAAELILGAIFKAVHKRAY